MSQANILDMNALHNLDLWPFALETVHDTSFPHGLYLCYKWSDSFKSAQSKKIQQPMWLWPLTFWHIVTSWVIFCNISSVHRSNRHRADIVKTSNDPLWPWSLTFWSGNGVGHIIIPSWVVFVSKPPMWRLWPWPLTFWHGNRVYHIIPSWVVLFEPSIYEVNQSNLGTEPWSRHGKNFKWPMWPWLEMISDTSSPQELYLCHIWSE